MFMKLISKLLFIFCFFLVIFFSIANPETVTLGIWPLESKIEIPLFFLTIVFLTVGILLGMFLSLFFKKKNN